MSSRSLQKPSLKGRALQMLAQREHSALELRQKLLRHARARAEDTPVDDVGLSEEDANELARGSAESEVEAVIAWLVEHRYLDNARFAESRVHARAGRFGNLRIRQELSQHGISLAGDDAQRLADSEYERARTVWQRKFGRSESSGAEVGPEKARQMRFLAQRGFSPEVIRRLLRAVAQGTFADEDGLPEL